MKNCELAVSNFARCTTLWLAILILPVAVSAQDDSQHMKACTLLTPAEWTAAIGGSVGRPKGIFTPPNPQFARNGDFWSCELTVGTRTVWIQYNTLPATEEGKKLARESQDHLRKEGYQIQVKDLNGSLCSTMLQPASSKDTLKIVGTNCGRDKGPYHVLVIVGATGPNDLISMEKVAALAEKAASRVPVH
jgi:hypothetical protein